MAEPSVAAGAARALLDLAVAKGADGAEIARMSGIRPSQLEDQDNRIPYPHYVALMRAAKELSGDPAFALHFGETFDIKELSIVGHMGEACESIADAFSRLGRFTRLLIDVELEESANGERSIVVRDEEGLWLVDLRKNPNSFPELTESSFARAATAARRLSVRSPLKAVHVTHPAPSYREEYDRIFGVPVVFESDRNALLMAGEEWMTQRPPSASTYVLHILQERAEALLEELDRGSSVRAQVEALLTPVLHRGEARMAAIAPRLGLSRPTLFRRLKAEGTTFERILDELRRKLALQYLGNNATTVSETAYLVGFSDPAAFSRAFKRWTGKTPRDMRSRNGFH